MHPLLPPRYDVALRCRHHPIEVATSDNRHPEAKFSGKRGGGRADDDNNKDSNKTKSSYSCGFIIVKDLKEWFLL